MNRIRLVALLMLGITQSYAFAQAPVVPAEKLPDFTAAGFYERFRRARVFVTAPLGLLGHKVSVKQGRKVLGSGVLGTSIPGTPSDRSSAEVVLPMPSQRHGYGPLPVRVDGKDVTTLTLPDLETERRTLGYEAPFQFQPAVFSGEDFPFGDFEQPSLMENALGPYSTQTTFYDANYNVVTTPDKPGRYGAVVKIVSRDEGTFKRFITLYRQPLPIDWREHKPLFKMEMPAEMGIDPEVMKTRSDDLNVLVTDDFTRGLVSNSDSAPLLAGLSEAKSDEGSAQWNNAYHRDELWWYGLKKKIGESKPLNYLVDLPDGYNTDRTKKWPLVLFLHGSGERGDDLSLLRRHGPPKLVAEGHKFPFILVSPQAPLGSYIIGAQMMDLLDEVSAKYNVDPDRVSMTGLSMGGYTTWFTAMEFPERFAAIAPMASGSDPLGAARLKNLPTWYFVGGKDTNIRPERPQQMVDAMQAAGVAFKFTEYPEAGHSQTWEKAYADPALYEWMLAQKRRP